MGQGLVGGVVFLGNAGGRVVSDIASEIPGMGEAVLPLACAIGVFALFYLLVLTTDSLARRVARLEGTKEGCSEECAGSAAAARVGQPSPQGAAAEAQAASTLAGTASASAASAEASRLDSFTQALGLTPREAEVCRYLVQGRSLPFIAEQLYVTAGTVKTHAIHIYRKAGVTSKQELISLFGESVGQVK